MCCSLREVHAACAPPVTLSGTLALSLALSLACGQVANDTVAEAPYCVEFSYPTVLQVWAPRARHLCVGVVPTRATSVWCLLLLHTWIG